MRTSVSGPLACCLLFSACLSAAEVKGKVVDPSGAPIPNAQVSVVSRVGVEAQTVSAPNGTFQLNIAETPGAQLVITAPGFSTKTLPLDSSVSVQLEIAPIVDSVRVVGSTIDVLASQQGGSVSIVPEQEIRQRNEPFAMDLLRYLPGMTFNQAGAAGTPTSRWWRSMASQWSDLAAAWASISRTSPAKCWTTST
jgi:hypothetical protein